MKGGLFRLTGVLIDRRALVDSRAEMSGLEDLPCVRATYTSSTL